MLPRPNQQIDTAASTHEETEIEETIDALDKPECFYPWQHEKPVGKTCKAMKKGIKHSVWKLARVARTIQG